MKACVLYTGKGAAHAASLLVTELEKRGIASVATDMKDGVDNPILCSFFLTVVRPAGLLGGKIPPEAETFFRKSKGLEGKRAAAIVLKKGLRSSTALLYLMKAMESEGMILRVSYQIASDKDAIDIGKKIDFGEVK